MKFNLFRTIHVFILVFLLPVFIRAQTIEVDAGQMAGVDYRRLNRIDTVINDYINKNWLTGAVTLVVKDNQLVQ